MQVDVLVTLRDSLGPFTCMAEQLITNLQAFKYLRIQEKVPASENISV